MKTVNDDGNCNGNTTCFLQMLKALVLLCYVPPRSLNEPESSLRRLARHPWANLGSHDPTFDEIDYACGNSMQLHRVRRGMNYHDATPR